VRIRTCATVLIVAYHAVLRRTVRCNQRSVIWESRALRHIPFCDKWAQAYRRFYSTPILGVFPLHQIAHVGRQPERRP